MNCVLRRRTATAFLVLAVLACGGWTEELVKRVAVVSAFDDEAELLVEAMVVAETRTLNGRDFYLGTLGGLDAVLFLSGESAVNAACYLQLALDAFEVSEIVFSGIAGGVNPALRVGDVVIPARWLNHDEKLWARQMAGDVYDQGHHSAPVYKDGAVHFGPVFPRATQIDWNGEQRHVFWFEADPALLDAARQAAKRVELERTNDDGERLPYEPAIKVGGHGVGGSSFVENAAYRTYLWESFEANAVDMESAAIAHVALVNETPFIVFRCLSDLAGADATTEARIFFKGLAARNAAKTVLAYLEARAAALGVR